MLFFLMLIKSLKLKNIRSYKNEIINFPAGSTLLAGDIGAGKSTILLAIEFALFGLRRKYLTGPALLRKGAREGEVELAFSLPNKEIIVKRVLKKNNKTVEQSSGHIILNGVKQDLTAVELKAKMLELLNYPMELLNKSKNLIYTYTVYTPQEEMKSILTEEPDIRLDVLRKVFGFSKYKVIRENSMIAFKEMRNKVKVFEGNTTDLTEKIKFKEQYMQELNRSEKILEDTVKKINIIKLDMGKKKSEMHALEKQREELQGLNQSLLNVKIRVEERIKNKNLILANIINTEEELNLLKNRIDALILVKPLNTKEEIEKELKNKESLVYSVINQENAVKIKLVQFQASITLLEKEINELNLKSKEYEIDVLELNKLYTEIAGKNTIQTKQKELEQRFIKINEKIQEFNLKKYTALETIEKITRLDNCPLCLQEVSHMHKNQIHSTETDKISVLNDRLNKSFQEKSIIETELNNISDFLENLGVKESGYIRLKLKIEMFNPSKIKDKHEQLNELTNFKQDYNFKLQEILKNDVITIKNEIDKLRQELKVWQRYEFSAKDKLDWKKRSETLAVLKIKQQEQLAEIERETIDLESNKKTFIGSLEKYKDLEIKFKILKKEIENINTIEKELIANQATQKKGIIDLERQLQILAVEIDKKEKQAKEMNKLNQMINWLNKSFIPLTVTIEQQMMAHVYNLFDELFKKWLNMLIEDDLLTVSLDQEFSPLICQNGFDVEYEHLSGGEKTSIALAYRLALNKIVNELYRGIGTYDIIILDEPTDGFSHEHLDKLKDVFDELKMNQLIIVSHENKIESFVEHVVHIVKNEHVSVVSD